MINDADTLEFMDIVYRMLTDKNYYILSVKESSKIRPGKILAGYYDREYIYLIPSVIIAAADTERLGGNFHKINMHRVLQQLLPQI